MTEITGEDRDDPAPAEKLDPGHFSRTSSAVLTVVLGEIDRHGQCRLATTEIAHRANCSERAVLLAMKDAVAADVLIVERRSRLDGRSLPNRSTRGAERALDPAPRSSDSQVAYLHSHNGSDEQMFGAE